MVSHWQILFPFQEMEYDGIKFGKDLDTPYAVAQVLNQEPGKLRMKDLREGKIVFHSLSHDICYL